jgi:hypothetical protein
MKSLGLLFCAVVLIALGLGAQLPSSASAADLDCADFSSQAEAQENLLPGDPYGLDGDSDGIACEDNPCPCSSGSPESGGGGHTEPAPPPPPPPYRLDKGAARHAARVVARRFAHRNPDVTTAAVGVCRRLGERRVDCLAVDRGSTSTSRTTCRLRIAVRARDRHPSPRLASSRCETESSLFLSAARAKQAMLAAANPIAGRGAAFYQTRINALEFEGVSGWRQMGPVGIETCTLELLAELLPSNRVRVETGTPLCRESFPEPA